MKRSELIQTKCWSCWWREGGHCFSEDFGEIPRQDNGIYLKGHEIKLEHISICTDTHQSKRSMLPFPKDKLVILSEFAKITKEPK